MARAACTSPLPVSMASAFESPIRAIEDGHLAKATDTLDRYAGRINTLLGESRRLWAGHAQTIDDERRHVGDQIVSFDDLVTTAVNRAFEQA